EWNRQLALRLSYYRGMAEFLRGDHAAARTRLEHLRHVELEAPDWFTPDVLICSGEMALLAGDREDALAVGARASEPPPPHAPEDVVARRQKTAERLRFLRDETAVAPAAEAAVLRRLAPAARAVYAGDAPGMAVLDSLPVDASPAVAFYRGE